MMVAIFQQLKWSYQFEPSGNTASSSTLSFYARNSVATGRIDQSHAQKESGFTTSIHLATPWPGTNWFEALELTTIALNCSRTVFGFPFHFIPWTPWRLGGFGDFRKKNSSFRLPYQRPSSSADCARELFNGSNGSASLVDCTRKNFLPGVCRFFVSDIISEVVLGSFCLMLPGLGRNH